MKTFIFQLIAASFLFTSCTGQNKGVQTIEPKQFAEKLAQNPNAQLLDVRTPEEFSSEHIDKAVNINWNDPSFTNNVASYDKSKPVYVYCKAGGRSAQAAAKLSELGFTEVYNLDGGIMKWDAAGLGNADTKPTGMTMAAFKKLLASDKKVLVDISAKWCGPCKKMAPYIEKMKMEMKDKLVIINIDADENKTLCKELNVEGLPTLIVYQNQKEVWKNLGYITEEDLKKHL